VDPAPPGPSGGASEPLVVAPPPGNPRFEHLDGLRAVAALWVIALHVSVSTRYFPGWQGAYIRQLSSGVTIFFLLSGFLLYRPFVAARVTGRNRVRARDYARRRLLRIVPAYWLALTVLALWPGLPGSPLGSDWWRYYGFVQDFHALSLFGGLGTAWSLGTEVSFYLALPVYALVLDRLARRRSMRKLVAVELTALATLSAVSLAFRGYASGSRPHLGYTLFGTFDWFALGMALAVVSVALGQREGQAPTVVRLIERSPWLCWAAAFGALTLGAAYWERTDRYDAYSAGPLHLIWAAIAFFLLLPAVFPGDRRGLPRRILSTRLLAWLGIISYGIYLWHLPLIPRIGSWTSGLLGVAPSGLLFTLLLYLLVAGAAAACAATSYYLVERPILRFKNGFRRSTRGGGHETGPFVLPGLDSNQQPFG
jgi:peptidoglycan/LPS O-acetylase OafA/YrhL